MTVHSARLTGTAAAVASTTSPSGAEVPDVPASEFLELVIFQDPRVSETDRWDDPIPPYLVYNGPRGDEMRQILSEFESYTGSVQAFAEQRVGDIDLLTLQYGLSLHQVLSEGLKKPSDLSIVSEIHEALQPTFFDFISRQIRLSALAAKLEALEPEEFFYVLGMLRGTPDIEEFISGDLEELTRHMAEAYAYALTEQYPEPEVPAGNNLAYVRADLANAMMLNWLRVTPFAF